MEKCWNKAVKRVLPSLYLATFSGRWAVIEWIWVWLFISIYPQVSGFSIREGWGRGEEKGWSDEAKTETWTWGEEFDFEVWMRGWRNSQLNYWLTLLLDWRHRLRLPKARVSPWDTPYISIFSPSVPFSAQTTSKPIHQAPACPPKRSFLTGSLYQPSPYYIQTIKHILKVHYKHTKWLRTAEYQSGLGFHCAHNSFSVIFRL